MLFPSSSPIAHKHGRVCMSTKLALFLTPKNVRKGSYKRIDWSWISWVWWWQICMSAAYMWSCMDCFQFPVISTFLPKPKSYTLSLGAFGNPPPSLCSPWNKINVKADFLFFFFILLSFSPWEWFLGRLQLCSAGAYGPSVWMHHLKQRCHIKGAAPRCGRADHVTMTCLGAAHRPLPSTYKDMFM